MTTAVSGQNRRRIVVQGRAAGPVGEQCILEVTANALWLDDHRLARGADEQRIRCVKLHDAIDIRRRKCLGISRTASASSLGPAFAADESNPSKATTDRIARIFSSLIDIPDHLRNGICSLLFTPDRVNRNAICWDVQSPNPSAAAPGRNRKDS